MKRFFNRIRLSTFFRFALSYMLMLVVVLGFMFSYMFFYVRKEARDTAITNQVNRLGRIANQHENYLSAMLNSAIQLGLSPDVQPFVFQQAPDRAYQLLQQLAPYTVTNSFCDQMYLIFHADDHIYSAAASMSLDIFLDTIRYEHVSRDELLRLIRDPGALTILPSQKVESPLINGSRTHVVSFLVPLGTSPANSKGTMMFTLSDTVYHKLFADAIKADNNTYILRDGQVLTSQRDFDVPTEQVLANLPEGGGSQAFYSGGEEWIAIAYRSGNWDMDYVSLLRVADIDHSAWSRMLTFIALAAALAAVGAVIALLLAHRNAAPIHKIVSMLPGEERGMDAFSSIQTGIRELSDRNTALTTQLERSLPMQKHDFVLRFMKGRYADRSEAIALADSLGMNIARPYYAAILHGVQDRQDQPLVDMRQPPFDQIAGVTAMGVELMAIKAHLYLVFSDTPEAIRTLALSLHQHSLERNGHAVVALSGVQTDLSAAPGAYLEAATAFDNRFVMNDSTLLEYADVSTSIEDILPQARLITESINQALTLRNQDMLSSRLDELLRFLKHTNMSPFAFRLIYNDVIDKLLRGSGRDFSQDRSVQAYYDIFSLSSCQSIDDLDALLRKLCTSIIDAPLPPQDAPVEAEAPSVISQAAAHIRDHYMDLELSISAIAEAFNMPMARFSLAFKEEMKLSPLEYLTLLRVERSKELLRQTDLSIKDIAAEIGYYDASSFIRRFKQMTGVTPLQYRRTKEAHDDAEG